MLLLGLSSDSLTSIAIANLSTLIGVLYYCNLTFRGYAILPFIRKPEYFIMPVPFLVMLFVMCTILGKNISFCGVSETVLRTVL